MKKNKQRNYPNNMGYGMPMQGYAGSGANSHILNSMNNPLGSGPVAGKVKSSIGQIIWKVISVILQVWLLFAVWYILVWGGMAITCNLIQHFEDNTVAVNIWGSIQNAFQGELEETLVLFGEKIFSNIPFVDLLNALFITKHSITWTVLLDDIVVAAMAGLIFFLVSRINYLMKTLLSKKGIYAAVESLWTVLSVCISLVLFAFLDSKFDDEKFIVIKIILIFLPTLLHALLLGFGLRDIKLSRILLHVFRSLLENVPNNLMLWVCSYFSFRLLTKADISVETSIVVTIYAGYFILTVYRLIVQGIEEYILLKRYKL